jgi:hypothetical protein
MSFYEMNGSYLNICSIFFAQKSSFALEPGVAGWRLKSAEGVMEDAVE